MYSLSGRHIYFFLIHANNSETVYKCVSKQNDNAYDMLNDSYKYFTLIATLFFHIYDHLCILCLPDIFLFKNTYGTLSDIHKYFTFGTHLFFYM